MKGLWFLIIANNTNFAMDRRWCDVYVNEAATPKQIKQNTGRDKQETDFDKKLSQSLNSIEKLSMNSANLLPCKDLHLVLYPL